MARKVRFRNQRLYNLRILVVSILFLFIVSCGLIVVDINKNYVLYGHAKLEIVRVQEIGQDIYQLSIFNNNYDVNLKYLKRDIFKLKNLFSKSGKNM